MSFVSSIIELIHFFISFSELYVTIIIDKSTSFKDAFKHIDDSNFAGAEHP